MTPKNRFGFVCLWWRRNDSDPRGKVKGFMSVTGIPVCPESALRSFAFKLQTLNPDQCLHRLNDEEGHVHLQKGFFFVFFLLKKKIVLPSDLIALCLHYVHLLT